MASVRQLVTDILILMEEQGGEHATGMIRRWEPGRQGKKERQKGDAGRRNSGGLELKAAQPPSGRAGPHQAGRQADVAEGSVGLAGENVRVMPLRVLTHNSQENP